MSTISIAQARVNSEVGLSTPLHGSVTKNSLDQESTDKAIENLVNGAEQLSKLESLTGRVSMSQLMALIEKIINASKELRSQVLFNRVDEVMSTLNLAKTLAESRKNTAQVKFGLNVGISSVSMVLQAAATYRTAQQKTVQDKHLKGGDRESLTPERRNEIAAGLQQARTAKYNNVFNLAQSANRIGSDSVEIANAENTRLDEETSASKEAKQKHDEQLNSFIEGLQNELQQLLKLQDAVQGASLATNR